MANINDFKIGINQSLCNEFPNIEIFTEKIKPDFQGAYFFIKILNTSQNKVSNIRYKKNICFDIQYFSNKENINADYNDMAYKLYDVLEYVRVNNALYRSNDMKHEVADGVLHFTLKFQHYVVKEAEKISTMQRLKEEVNHK